MCVFSNCGSGCVLSPVYPDRISCGTGLAVSNLDRCRADASNDPSIGIGRCLGCGLCPGFLPDSLTNGYQGLKLQYGMSN